MVTGTKITGLRELGAALHGLGEDVQQRLARSATGAGARIVRAAVEKRAGQQPTLADAPFEYEGVVRQPGEIARNVITKHLKDSPHTSEHIVTVRSNKKNGYIGRLATFNEFGTVEMSPQPFMGPGFDESKEGAARAIAESLSKGIKAAARRAKKAQVTS